MGEIKSYVRKFTLFREKPGLVISPVNRFEGPEPG